MDNKKIGKLIANLRKKQNLTQQELGDKVGVGFRAVSKWERGLTLPDITIINELSKILGISSDELLSGELNKESQNKDTQKKKISSKVKITISIITAILIIITSLFIYYNNKTYVYGIRSKDDTIYIEGQVVFKGNKLSILINNLRFTDENLTSTTIKNYEYQIMTGEEYIFSYGYTPTTISMDEEKSIEQFAENFHIHYNDETNISRKQILKDNIKIILRFLNKNNEEVEEEINILLLPTNEKK